MIELFKCGNCGSEYTTDKECTWCETDIYLIEESEAEENNF